MSRAVLLVTFILFFLVLLWQKWVFALTDYVVAACPAHRTCTFPFSFYLQFSKTLNFSSSSSWPSSVALRERCLFWQDLQLNFPGHNGWSRALPGCWGMNYLRFMRHWAALSSAETEECLQDRATSEGAHGSALSGIPSDFYFFALNQDLKEPLYSDL